MTALVECPSCKAPLAESQFNKVELVPCGSCGCEIRADVYPAYVRPISQGSNGEALVIESEASCFYHPQKKATLPCQGCGRFICALCDCDLHGEHFCPACLQAGQKKGKIKRLEQERVLYDNIALSLAVYPLLIFYFTIITAPLSLGVAVRFWNAPRSIVHRTKARFVFAILIAGLEMAGWAALVFYLVTRRRGHG
jgi:hypothetical protein